MLRNWLGFNNFNSIVNIHKKCVTIATSQRSIQKLHFLSGKLSLYNLIILLTLLDSDGIPIFVNFTDQYVDELAFNPKDLIQSRFNL